MSASVSDVDRTAIDRAVEILARGGLVAMPTETVYGLAADAHHDAAVRAIFAAKGRPADHPVIVHVAQSADPASALLPWSSEPSEAAQSLVRAFWPGPLTVVLPRASSVLDSVTGGQNTVGLRCPSHPWAQALLQAHAQRSGHALAAPSANSFGRISPTTAAHVRADLGEKPHGKIDLILDGGACPVGIESTIVDCSGARVRLLRPGSISAAQIEQVLGYALLQAGEDAPRVSGRLAAHYAPRTPLELIDEAQLQARLSQLETEPAAQRLALLAPTSFAPFPAQVIAHCAAASEPEAYARRLYACLHELDAAGAQRVLIVRPPQGAQWEAIHDRLNRAAAGAGISEVV